ncbi:hypothetical protein PS3A_40230 [Pseudomonas sp. 3A(2025)]
MFNSALNSRRLVASRTPGVANALSMIEGHHRFLKANTGDTTDAQVQHFVQNNQGVLSNNRHFIALSQMEYQPNGDGTTEGQALHILGYVYAYLATLEPAYLEAARWHWDAYVKYFYAGQPIPETPGRWICNWIINSKEPVLSNWPIDAAAPTHSGFKGVPFTFTNGVTQIPHGAPHWGQYLDKATFAFEGALAWDAINAGVKALKADGETDWNRTGTQHDVDWIIAWTGQKIDWDGNVLSSGHALAERGTVKLKNTSLNGTYKFNYANRQPVEYGGQLIPRNAVQHNRPLQVPLLGTVNQMGNAADGEQWFADACYLLWKITGEAPFKKAMDACLFTAHEYTSIDSTDKFFRQSTVAGTPFTDGISYDFIYPSAAQVTYGRNNAGFITAKADRAASISLEQQSIWFRLNQASSIRTTFGGVGINGAPVTAKAELLMSLDKEEDHGQRWGFDLPASTSAVPVVRDVPLGSLQQLQKADGSAYIGAAIDAVSDYGGLTYAQQYETGVLGSRSCSTIKAFFPNDDAGFVVGFWSTESGLAPIKAITYKSDGETDLRFEDANGWRWYWILPNTGNAWVTHQLLPGNLVLSGYQPNHPDDPDPAAPVYDQIDQFTVLLENGSDTNISWTYAYINDVPPLYVLEDGYSLLYRVTLSCSEPFTALLGDCTVIGYRDDSLAYTPGVIPFSNIYEEGSEQIGAWHGMPYPGYQYPMIYCLEPQKYARHLTSMVDFMYDSQQWYYAKFGELGPGASAYIWNRWDNYKYGSPDTFTMYHWGDGTAWSGYQPRAFQAACRAWQELAERGAAVPAKLKAYVENWIAWLASYVSRNAGALPTDFPMTTVPKPLPNDFTGHMTGLWLAGACMAAMAGCTHPQLDALIEACVTELQDNYIVTPEPNQPMNGSWSPGVRLGTDNGMFFGFWAGEILRGLSMYILLKQLGPGASVFDRLKEIR